MAVILDLLSSTLISGFIILMSLRLNFTMLGTADASNTTLNVQENLVDAVATIEYDFRKIGYNIPDPKLSIAIADTSRIRFRADMNQDGVVDSVEWWLGPQLNRFPNKSIRPLYRKVYIWNSGGGVIDTSTLGAAFGVTSFQLRYMNQDGVPTSTLSQIWIIETTLKIESAYKIQDQVNPDSLVYATGFWRQTRLASRNISRHG